MNSSSPRKILVISWDNLGDTVMATALCRPLKNLFPDAQIGFWVKQYSAGLLANSVLISRVHAADPFWDKSPGRSKGNFSVFMRTWREVRNEKYDAALILNTEWRRASACWLAGIPTRIGYRRRKSGFFLTESFAPQMSSQHFVDDHHVLLESWAKKVAPREFYRPVLEVSENERQWLETWFRDKNKNAWPYVVFHPVTGDALKNWPLSHWRKLAQMLSSERPDIRFVWVGGPSEEKQIQEILTPELEKKSILLLGRPLPEVKAVLSRAGLFVGGDSGPSHMAAALNIPALVLFGPTNPDRCAPLGSNPVVILRKNPLEDLKVSEVGRHTIDLLNKFS